MYCILDSGFFGAIAVVIAIPSFMGHGRKSPNQVTQQMLDAYFKECVFIAVRSGKEFGPKLSELSSFSWLTDSPYADQIIDLHSSDQSLNPDRECKKTKLLARLKGYKDNHGYDYGLMGFGIDFENWQKFCITREGDKRDDWSCE